MSSQALTNSKLTNSVWLPIIATFGLLVPAVTFAQTGGNPGLQSTSLPFLRQASEGPFVTTTDYLTTDPTAIGGGLTSQANHCRFRDISGDKAEKAINYLYDHDVAGGRQPCMFQPNYAATRGEAATMAVRAIAATIPTDITSNPFPDEDKTAWHARYVSTAKTHGIVSGYPDGYYRADKPVNKVEAMKIITRAFDADFTTIDLQKISQYSDLELNQWYIRYVDAALDQGLIENTATDPKLPKYFYPASYITRSELAEMIYKMMLRKSA